VICGLPGAGRWLQPLPAGTPRLHVSVAKADDAEGFESRLDCEHADLRLHPVGRLCMRRGEDRADFSFPDPPADETVLHPYLAPAAALAQLWAGREAFHGGAAATAAGAVALFADKQGGKSTTLAWLASEHALPVLADDLIVLDDGAVLAGPRCLDLRRDTILDRLADDHVELAPARDRLRLTLDQAPAETPLAASVMLRWGAKVAIAELPPLERLRRLLPNRMYRDRLSGNPEALLKLTALPLFTLTRPRGRAGLQEGARALLDHFA
jgi:hypothetical protein